MTWQRTLPRSVPYRLQQRCFKRDRLTCQRCGYVGTPNSGDLNADHIHNLAEGGATVLENLMTLCVPCHRAKTASEQSRGVARRCGRRPPPLHPADALGGSRCL